MRVLTVNPVLDLELRQRSRTMRSMLVITLYLLLLIGVMWLAYQGSQLNNFGNNPLEALTTQAGRSTFEWLLVTQLGILMLVVPAISSGVISGERDRQTLIPLQVTLLGPVQIFFGKVFAAASFTLLLLISSAPLLAIPFLLGGVTLIDILSTLALLLFLGFVTSIIGVSCSSLFKRTQVAALAAFTFIFGLFIGTLVLFGATAAIDGVRGTDTATPRMEAMWANPFTPLADVGGSFGRSSFIQIDSPLSAVNRGFAGLEQGPDVFINSRGQAINQRTGNPVELKSGIFPLWLKSVLTLSAIAAFMAWVGIRKLRLPQQALSL